MIRFDFGSQWRDSYTFDLFCVGFYNSGQMYSFGITILGLWIDIEFWKV